MKAQIIHQFGSPDVFTTTDIPTPELKPGHVLIEVKATSVNPIDCKIRSGAVANIAPDFPAILHGDVAGIIKEISADVTEFKIGDEVYGFAGGVKGRNGALADYMLADARLIAKKPNSFSFEQAAAMPVVAITCWNALCDKAKLQANQMVLIHGGVGGVGHIAVQLAKALGAKVYATVSSESDAELARSLGADVAINFKTSTAEEYTQEYTNGVGFDVVFDTVGGDNLKNSFIAAKTEGIVVTTAARTTQDLTLLHNKALTLSVVFVLLPLLTNQGCEHHGERLRKIAEFANAGKIKPLIDARVFNFDEVSQAHQLLESGQAKGKVVLVNR